MLTNIIHTIREKKWEIKMRKIIFEWEASLFWYKKNSNINLVFEAKGTLYNFRYFIGKENRKFNRRELSNFLNWYKS